MLKHNGFVVLDHVVSNAGLFRKSNSVCLRKGELHLLISIFYMVKRFSNASAFLRLAQMERSNGSLPTDSSSATGSM